jgi:hypothetical protein
MLLQDPTHLLQVGGNPLNMKRAAALWTMVQYKGKKTYPSFSFIDSIMQLLSLPNSDDATHPPPYLFTVLREKMESNRLNSMCFPLGSYVVL